MDRTILHCDMNGFFASVELLERPDLVDRPMAVCGNPDNRHGIILAKNEIAKKYGVKTAETLWQARRKCPDLVCVPPHHSKYRYYSGLINEIYRQYTDMVEPFSIDESWLDVTGSLRLFGSGKEIADTIRNRVREKLGLTLSAGVSWNKIFAKMGSEYRKPDATTCITRENYRDMLFPMDVGQMFFVGKATAARLRQVGILTIGDLAAADRNSLVSMLGKQGDQLYIYANGLEDSPVSLYTEKEPVKSVGNGMTFRRNLTTETEIRLAVTGLADTVAGRLRKHGKKACGIKIDIKDTELKTISRQKQLESPVYTAGEIVPAAMDIIKGNWPMGKPIRMLTVTGINLVEENAELQLSLFNERNVAHEKEESLEHTMDTIRSKYGNSSVAFAGLSGPLGAELGLDDE